jgi:hypothetical protein
MLLDPVLLYILITDLIMSARTATVERKTSETEISCTINLDHDPAAGKQAIDVFTGIGFLDHVRSPSDTQLKA